MATAGAPASARPVSARSAIRLGQLGAKAISMVAAAAVTNDATMTVLRPRVSDSAPAANMATASTPVVTESDRLAAAGDSENVRAKAGISGWTQ